MSRPPTASSDRDLFEGNSEDTVLRLSKARLFFHLETHFRSPEMLRVVTWEKTSERTPHSFLLKKTPAMVGPADWKDKVEQGRRLLQSIRAGALQRIFREDYERMMAAMEGQPTQNSSTVAAPGINTTPNASIIPRQNHSMPPPTHDAVRVTGQISGQIRSRTPDPMDALGRKKRRISATDGPVVDLTTP
jgi:hypothetical protein